MTFGWRIDDNVAMKPLEKTARYLARNVAGLRKTKGWSQQQLARAAGVPRTTLTHVESGSANPSLSNLVKISSALQVGIEELLSRPRSDSRLIPADEVPVDRKKGGAVRLFRLLPDPIQGLEIDRLELEAGASMVGTPHVLGTKEYLTPIQGSVEVIVAGESFLARKGSVLAFPGEQAHSYRNPGESTAKAISVVVPVPYGV